MHDAQPRRHNAAAAYGFVRGEPRAMPQPPSAVQRERQAAVRSRLVWQLSINSATSV